VIEVSEKTRRSRWRRGFRTVLAVSAVLVLTACGATIDTTLTVADDGSGSRVMVVTLDADGMAQLNTGAAEVDASIRKRLPTELAYPGLKSTSDGGVTAEFTLAFASADEYTKKAYALLAVGGNSTSTVDFEVTDSILLKGLTINEDFGSYDLLKWMFDGLLEDGIVSESNASDMYEVGDSVLNFGGLSVNQNASYDYSDIIDNGFSSITMATDLSDSKNITRKITYVVDPTKYGSRTELYDEFFLQVVPSGADFVMVDDGMWEITFTGDASSIAMATDTATAGSGSELTVESGTAPEDPATLTRTVTNVASCENICSPDSGAVLYDAVTVGPEFAPREIDADMSDGTPMVFEYAPTIRTAEANFHFDILGSATATVKFVVPNESVALAGNGFTKLFQPPKGVGTVVVEKGHTDTVFTTTIEGDDVAHLASRYAKWAPHSSVEAVEGEGSNMFGRDVTYAIDPGLAGVVKSHVVTDLTTTSVTLPIGHVPAAGDGTADTRIDITGATVSYEGSDARPVLQASGPTLLGLLLTGVGLIMIVGAILVLLKYRRQLISKLQGQRAGPGEQREPGRLDALLAAQTRRADAPRSQASMFSLRPVQPRESSRGSTLHWQAAGKSRIHVARLSDFRSPQPQLYGSGRTTLMSRSFTTDTSPVPGSLIDHDVAKSQQPDTTHRH
jgi:hypothetical protein